LYDGRGLRQRRWSTEKKIRKLLSQITRQKNPLWSAFIRCSTSIIIYYNNTQCSDEVRACNNIIHIVTTFFKKKKLKIPSTIIVKFIFIFLYLCTIIHLYDKTITLHIDITQSDNQYTIFWKYTFGLNLNRRILL